MFSLARASCPVASPCHPPVGTPGHLASETRGAPSAHVPGPIVEFHAEVLRSLREGDAVTGRLRAAVPALMVHLLEDWPEDRSLRVHTQDDAGRCHGPRAATRDHVESVHVMHRADGHFAAAAWADLAPEDWVHCGAASDSFFDAALYGLLEHDPDAYGRLVEGTRQGTSARTTDARCLREALVARMQQDPVTAMDVLVDVFPYPGAKGKGPVDRQLLMELRAMGPGRVIAIGRLGLATIYNVSYSTLKKSISKQGNLTPAGWETLRRAEDPDYRPRGIHADALRDLAGRGPLGGAGLVALAQERNFSLAMLCKYLDPGGELTVAGSAFVNRSRARPGPTEAARPPASSDWPPDLDLLGIPDDQLVFSSTSTEMPMPDPRKRARFGP